MQSSLLRNNNNVEQFKDTSTLENTDFCWQPKVSIIINKIIDNNKKIIKKKQFKGFDLHCV